jgi:hypothetical protein
MQQTAKTLVLVDGPAERIAALQQQFPAYEFLPASTERASLEGREIRVLADFAGKKAPSKSLKDLVEIYCKGQEAVLVRDIVEWLGVGDSTLRVSWELRVVKELKAMGWGRVSTRRFHFGRLMVAYMPRVLHVDPNSEPKNLYDKRLSRQHSYD